MVLKPLPVRDPSSLVAVYGWRQDVGWASISYPDYRDLKAERGVLAGLAGSAGSQFALSRSEGGSDIVWGEVVTGDYFDVLGLTPEAGRFFGPAEADDGPGAPTLIISDRLWRSRFGRADVVGRGVRLNGIAFTIAGVAPPRFLGTRIFSYSPDMWIPVSAFVGSLGNTGLLDNRSSTWLNLIGRRAPGVPLAAARVALATVGNRLAATYPTNRGVEFRTLDSRTPINPWAFDPAGTTRTSWLIMGGVALVLLIACGNVASLLLARATTRRREIAVRLALGAGRARLTRQLLTESLVLALLGGAAGLVVAVWESAIAATFIPPLEFATTYDAGWDARVLGFALVASVTTAVVFGFLPALRSSGEDPVQGLRSAAPAAGKGRLTGRELLVVAQVALAFVICVAAGLFARSLRHAQRLDLGYTAERGVKLSIDVGVAGYDRARGVAFYRALLERVRALPGVEAASAGFPLPLDGYAQTTTVLVRGRETTPEGSRGTQVAFSSVASGYFTALGTPLLEGRAFVPADTAGAPGVAIVNRAMAARLWPDEQPVGRQFSINGPAGPWITVVGVVPTGKYQTLNEAPRPYLFLPAEQSYRSRTTIVGRTAGDPAPMLERLRRDVAALDGTVPVFGGMTLRNHRAQALDIAHSTAAGTGIFAVLSLVLSLAGIYGVIAYTVARRTREIGIRVALGAGGGDVLQMVLYRGATITVVGLGLGVVAALAASRLLRGALYDVAPADPLTYGLVAVLLLAAALAASWLPARRATRVSPMVALRSE
jgi:predicted permease